MDITLAGERSDGRGVGDVLPILQLEEHSRSVVWQPCAVCTRTRERRVALHLQIERVCSPPKAMAANQQIEVRSGEAVTGGGTRSV